MELPDIRSLGSGAGDAVVARYGLPRFRAKQIDEWLWKRDVASFEGMTNLPKQLRENLAEDYSLALPTVAERQQSVDGTRKYLMSFSDGACAETVGIPSNDGSRLTVCFSTQAGCGMGCSFCATGQAGFTRNLQAHEMFYQVKLVQNDFNERVSNIVGMGQGEPFANYDAVLAALRLMNEPDYGGVGARHITVSTCGIIPGIERFMTEPEQFTLAVSLHSAVQDTRDELMPGVRAYPLPALKSALKAYGDATKRRPTLEYALIDGVNDSDEQLDALVGFAKGMLCHVNLIPLNPISGPERPGAMKPSDRMDWFETQLKRRGVECSVRASRGGDIDGACGQLAQRKSR